MTIKKEKINKGSIEQNLRALEALVQAMEAKELPLDEAMKLFEEGIALSRVCQKLLTEAEQKVTILMATDLKVENTSMPNNAFARFDESEDSASSKQSQSATAKHISSNGFDDSYDDDDIPF